MFEVNTEGKARELGTITLADSPDGLVISPQLSGLPPGERGFHIHENPDCGPKEKEGKKVAALAAGGHYDPNKTGHHAGPGGGGHLGDLPRLVVASDGTASKPMTVKGLKLSDIKNRSLMIHAGSDNYSDAPEPLGGGGARFACGVVK